MLNVKTLCKQRGITLKQLAEKMGVAPEAITRTLSPNGNPTLSTLNGIAKALGVEVHELFDNYDSSKKISGFIEFGGEVHRVNSLADLKMVYNKVCSQFDDEGQIVLSKDESNVGNKL